MCLPSILLGPKFEEKALPLDGFGLLEDVSKFYLTNMKLSEPARYSMVAHSGYSHSYIDITEESLLEALPLTDVVRHQLQEIFGIKKTSVTKAELRQAAILQKAVLIRKSIFRFSRDEEQEKLRRHK